MGIGLRCLSLCVALSIAALGAPSPAAAAANPYVEIVSMDSGSCLDVSNGSTANRANVQIWHCDNVRQQRWQRRYVGDGYYEIVNLKSQKCLDVDNGLKYDGANVQQYDCVRSAPQQKWRMQPTRNGFFQLVAKHSQKCLDVHNGLEANGTNVKQWSCVNVPQQQWIGVDTQY
jgi:hypothetical protein